MKTCSNPKCNMSGIPDDAKFCPKCGKKIVNSVPKDLLVVFIFLGIVLGVIGFVSLYLNPQIQRNREETYPSGFILNTGEVCSALDYYKATAKNPSQPLFCYKWQYSEFTTVTFCINNFNGELIGGVIYNDPQCNGCYYYDLTGTADDNIWEFDTLDKDWHKCDHYEVVVQPEWYSVSGSESFILGKYALLVGTCTNKKGCKFNFKATHIDNIN